MVDAGKLDSAFDLVSRLHSEKSYDIAIRLADRNYKLADEVEKLKKYKFPDDDAPEKINPNRAEMVKERGR